MTGIFSDQFRGEIDLEIAAVIGELRPLEHPITYPEVERSVTHLNNNQASGSDELPEELLKCGSEILSKPIADSSTVHCLNSKRCHSLVMGF